MNLMTPSPVFTTATPASDYILDLLVCWNDRSFIAGTSTLLGSNTIRTLILTPDRVAFSVTSVHPLSGEVYKQNINQPLTAELTDIRTPGLSMIVRRPESPLQVTALELCAYTVIFDTSFTEVAPADIDIAVDHPITCTVSGRKVTLAAAASDVLKVSVESDNINSIRRINGLAPVNGNIDIIGVGGVQVSIRPVSE